MADGLFKSGEGLLVFQVPDVVADKMIWAARQTKRIFELGSGSQERFALKARHERGGCKTTCPAKEVRLFPQEGYHRVVNSHIDRPIMQQEGVRQGR